LVLNGGSLRFGNYTVYTLGALGGEADLRLNNNSGAAVTLTVGNSRNLSATYSGDLLGTGSLTKAGTGTLTLTGANNFSGDMWFTAGSLVITDGGSLTGVRLLQGKTGGSLLIANATVSVASGASFAASYGAIGTGTVTVASGGVLNVGNGSGKVFVGGGDQGGSQFGTGILTLTGGGVVNVAAPGGASPLDSVYLGGYGGQGTINLDGGTLVSARPFTNGVGDGTINFNGGVLRAGLSSTAFINGITSSYVKSGGAVLDTNGYDITIPQAFLNLAASPGGGLTKQGAGKLTLPVANTYTGGATIAGGTLRVNIAGALGSGSLTFVNGVLEDGTGGGSPLPTGMTQVWAGSAGFAGTTAMNTGTGAVNITADTTVDVRVSALTVAGNISGVGGLTKIGSGSLTLSGTNTYAGATAVNTGTLVLNGPGALPAGSALSIAAGATVILQNGAQVSAFTGGGNLVYGLGSSIVLGGDGASGNWNSVVSGSVSLTKGGSGSITVSSAGSFTGKTTIQSGTLAVSSLNGFSASSYTWSIFAGAAGSSGYVDATGTAARFVDPDGICFDSSGNLYVSECGGATIRRITPAGVVTTFAGANGAVGSTNASTPTAARFNGPEGMAFDSAGNLYVAEWTNCSVRKITPAGVVTTLAGSGVSGSANGTGTAASFGNISGITVDLSGNVFVADRSNHTIRRITPAGVVTTVAGATGQLGNTNGLASAARFNMPWGIVFAPNGNLYIADWGNHSIRMLTPEGVVSTVAGTGMAGGLDGAGNVATFNGPIGITADPDGNLIVADNTGHTIRRITTAGVVSTLGGAPGVVASTEGVGTAARFKNPQFMAFDQSGALYVADRGNFTIRRGVPTIATNLTQSSLGAPVAGSNATIGIGSLTATGVLLYSGTGETTNRAIDLAGTTGGAVLDQSGTGSLRFLRGFTATGVGSKTLVLQGSTSGSGEIAGAIVNSSSITATSLFKQGTGRWTLSGASTYTGGTTLAQGTLALGNAYALGTGTLSIFEGATLDASRATALQAIPQVWNGSFTFLGSNSLDLSAGSTSLTANTTVTVSAGSLTAGNLSGGYTLSKDGLGTLILSGTNSLTGTVNLLAGTLIINGTGAFPPTTTLNTGTGTSVILQNGAPVPTITGSGNLVYPAGLTATLGLGDASGTSPILLSGSSSLIKIGTGTVALTSSSSFTGKTSIQSGALSVSTLNRVTGGTAFSSLGAPTNVANATIDLGSLNSSGTLIVTGSAQTTDRVINLAGGPLVTNYISADFSTTPAGATVLGNAFISGGECVLTPAVAGTNGYLLFNAFPSSPTVFTAQFDYRVADGSGADGTSFNYGAIGSAPGDESGMPGASLVIALIEYGSQRVEAKLNGALLQTGYIGLIGAAYKPVVVDVSASNQLTVTIGGTVVINTNLGASYASVDKSTWKFGFAGRSGVQTNKHSIDNLSITGVGAWAGGIAGGGVLEQAGSGNLVFSGGVTSTSPAPKLLTLRGSTAGTGQISGVIANNSTAAPTSLRKEGTGTWILSAANTYSGGTTVSQGTLVLGNASALGTGSLILNQGVTVESTSAFVLPVMAKFLNGDFRVVAGGTLDLTAGSLALQANSTVTIAGGTPSGGVIASYALNGDGNDASGNAQTATGTGVTYGVGRDGTAAGAAVFNGSSSFFYRSSLSQAPGSQMTISAWIRTTADGMLMTIGRSPSNMDGQQAFLISGGYLKYWDYNNGSFGFNGAVSTQIVTSGAWRHVAFVKNGTTGTYYVDGTAAGTITGPDVAHIATDFCVGKDYRDNNGFFSGSIDDFRLYARALSAQEIAFLAGMGVPTLNLANVSGGFGLGKDGPGTMFLSGTNTYTGPTTVLAGSLIINGANALPSGSAIVAATGATVILQNGAQLTSFSGAGSLVFGPGAPATLGGGDLTGTSDVVLSGSSSLTKVGTGSITLANPASFTGKTWIQSGTLGVLTLNRVVGGTALSSLGAPVTAANGTIDLGSLAATGSLLFTGTAQSTDRILNLAGTTGGGVLDHSGTGLLAFTGSVTATGAGSKTLTLQGGAAGTGVLSGVIANNSAINTTALLKQGAGSWTLSGANTYTGGTTVAAGILALSGGADRLATTGDIRVSGGTLDLGGNSQSTSGNVILSGGSIQNGTLRATGSNVELQSGLVSAILSGQSALETDLKARLSFEGNLNDGSSVGTHSGTWVGTGSFASTAPVGVGAGVSGAYFNGSTRVTLAGGDLNMNASTAFTVSVWIRTGFTDTATRVILGKSAGTGGSTPVLYVNSAGQVVYDIFGIGAVSSNSVVRTGNWVHVALTGVFGSNTLSLYINGVLEKTGSFAGASEPSVASGNGTWPFTIGQSLAAFPGGYFIGNIDEVSFWQRTLSASEISTLATSGIRSFGLNKTTTGTVVLTGTNSFGASTLSQGTLVLGNNSALGKGTFTIADGTTLDASTAVTLNAAAHVWGGSFTFLGSNALDLSAGPVSLTANATVRVAAGTLTAANISGGFLLGKSGAGTLVLAGTNNFSGPLSLDAGTLVINGPNALPSGVAVNLASGATLLLQNGATTPTVVGDGSIAYGPGANAVLGVNDVSGTSSVVLSGSSSLTKVGSGSTTLLNFGSFTGKTWVQQGALWVASLNSVVSPATYTWSTFAGSAGNVGSADGSGSVATFKDPCSVATDSSGNVFVVDCAAHTIRKITPAGVVSTFAGSYLLSGVLDGQGSAARFNTPAGIAVDRSDNIYVAEYGGAVVRKITPAGYVTTLAGSANSFWKQ
jgi:fibronectin-binding autotransporter adhesin